MLRAIVPIVLLAIYIYGLIDCIRTPSSEVRTIPKVAWIVVIIVLPVLGVVFWFLMGRTYSQSQVAQITPRTQQRSGSSAPDDDSEFLLNLHIKRKLKAEAERLKKLEAELKAREAQLPPKTKPDIKDVGSTENEKDTSE